ncbi:UvrD-helicase domain-containing protein [Nocardioides sp. zg-536]|uniref:DNA 3'-5' helicase n=1 Tax=Nocardioides faecalis TaxID=2803858 RepID=A0A939BXF6_9ACTN|nr:UvrD-helicase domain-containing protein [Nocardioides faecalis]MBM9458770.1 UvrD-helicase domain-containing protein [Nocardioides faecalis]QVI60188.1 UvrD-helicase domain-containing protein [Nocardioides faecalis]
MEPVVLAAVGALVMAAVVVALVRTRAARLAALGDDAEPSLRELRAWKATVEQGLATAVADGRWVTRDVRHDWEAQRPTPSTVASKLATRKEAGAEARDLIAFVDQDLRDVVDSTNERILCDELRSQRAFFDTIETKPLTDEQATAVATFDNRVQVIAAAGSGKTSVMVARAAYAIRREIVPADRILLLAFNKDAAAELQQRVDERLDAAGIDPSGLSASTFHAFGLNVIGTATGRKPRLAPWIDGGQDVAMVSRIVDELRDRSPEFRFKWDMYRLLFARMAEDPAGGEPDAYDYATRATGFRTFNGETVKSQGERMIADFLFLNGVKYEYERPYDHDVADTEHSQYRPDFYYPDVDVWHEHWALDRNGEPPPEFDGYAAGMTWKKSLHDRFGTALIETTWASIIDQSGFQPLAADLRARGITLDWNPDRPVRGATPVKHEDLARLMRSFMAHVKSNSLTREDLDRRLDASPAGIQRYRARVFVDLYWTIHDEWQRRLDEDDAIDFEDMLVRAAGHLEAGDVDMGFDLVLVDEFQDASQARARLARALVAKPHRYLLAVGDDWQSINRFAGADLSVMTSFSEWFGEGLTLRLQTTFRSPQSICDTAGEFVAKNPRQFRKDVSSIHAEYGPPVSLVRVGQPHEVPSAVERVLVDLAARVRSGEIRPGRSGVVEVDVLGRYRFDRDVMPRSFPPELRVRFRTVHSSKGLEADFVVLPNVGSGTYGFPSEVVDDPVLALAMSEADPFPHAEERRLFYVALTRARRQLTLVGVQGHESAFVTELLKDQRLELSPLSTVDLSEPCPDCEGGVLVVRKRRSDGREFLGCSRFPSCRFTRNTA